MEFLTSFRVFDLVDKKPAARGSYNETEKTVQNNLATQRTRAIEMLE